ncbi:MAG: gliding motility-associated ABC transporter substrate-binding protein GldG [Chlorobi bacterium]|nr:gliding motility-associated ABC transporter substrate-binding protein GldG [Chlorobiota bacterium]
MNTGTAVPHTGSVLLRKNLASLVVTVAVIAIVGWISSQWFFRIDLTTDKRYTLHDKTKHILKNLDIDVYIQVFLDGEMPVGFKRMQNAVRDMLTEFQAYAGRHLTYKFTNPSDDNPAARQKIYNELYRKGLRPTDVQAKDKEGGTSSKILFPGALVNVNDQEMAVNFLNNNPTLPASVNLNHSIEGIEYNLILPVHNLTTDTIFKVAFTEGHGELPEPEVEDIQKELARFYTIDRGVIGGKPGILDNYAAVIIAKPSKPFSEADKFVLDQYLMHGGKILWLLDRVAIDADSLMYASFTFGLPQDLNLDDLLFKYGVRINPSLIQDVRCSMIPVNTAIRGNAPHYVPAPWLYYPLLEPQNHPVSRNLNLVQGRFVNPLDTVSGNGSIRKEILLTTSDYSRILGAPLMVNLEEIRTPPKQEAFNAPHIPVAALVEGTFESAFKNRMPEAVVPGYQGKIKKESVPTRMIVVADGDIIRNDVRMSGDKVVALPLGQDRITQQTYGNKDFIVNAVNYLVDDQGLLDLRSREFKLRLLDRTKILQQRTRWQIINSLGPLVIILLLGFLIRIGRRKKYAG